MPSLVIMAERREEMYAAAFKARHGCPVGNKSMELPGLRILHWCLNNRDIFQVSGPKEQLDSFQDWLASVAEMRYGSRMREGALLITQTCCCVPDEPRGSETSPTITNIIEEVGVWDIPPIVYREGWESWRVIAWNEESVREMFQKIRSIGDVQIESLRAIENARMEQMMLMPASDIFSGLTDRQISAVVLGLENGYYSLPSETKVERLAQGAGLSLSTFSEHLRKAEKRIFRNLRPYLQAYAFRMPGEAVIGDVRPLPARIV